MNPFQIELIKVASQDIGQMETEGSNNSPRIRQYLSYTNLPLHSPYCASACSFWIHTAATNINVDTTFKKSGSALHLWELNHLEQIAPDQLTAEDLPVVGINFDSDMIHGHAFLVTQLNGTVLTTIDPNSNNNGSHHGDGVYLLHVRKTTDTNRKGYLRIN